MQSKVFFFAIMMWLVSLGQATAQPSSEKILPLDARIAPDGLSVELSWFDADPPRVGSVTVKRRRYGQTGGQSWQTLAEALGPVMRYRDETIRPGIAYEYQVLRSARDIVDVGYWLVGSKLPAPETRGTAHMVIDRTLAEDLSPRLNRFTQDLVGDGWNVQQYLAPRGKPGYSLAQVREANGIKESLRAAYMADPFGQHAVILIGHIPIVYSGMAQPDGHNPVPHPTDLFYVEMTGQWQLTREGAMAHNALPSDFIEMQIGRIDFSNLAGDDRDMELQLLRAYFDKNHHWRRGLLGDLREAYGGSNMLKVDRAGLRSIVGPAAVFEGGHHSIGEEKPWLWGMDFGDYNGRKYLETYANKAVFALNFGSGKQRFEGRFNTMTALLAQPWYTLAVGWGGRPSWWPHHMALGGSIGKVHLRTVNNGEADQPYRESMDYFPTGEYLWRNPIWVNLLGDPTTRAFPLSAPRAVTVAPDALGHMTVSWQASADPETTGYKVYRAPSGTSAFIPLGGEDSLITGLSFTDEAPVEQSIYMVRAYGLKTVYSGSFYTYSQGAFASLADAPKPDVQTKTELRTAPGQPVALPAAFNDTTEGEITALVEGPDIGTLDHRAEGLYYIPPEDFHGTLFLRFSVSRGLQTDEGGLTISVGIF